MKKYVSILLAIIIVVSFSACNESNTAQVKNTYPSTKNEETTKIVTTVVPTEPSTEELIPSIDDLNDAQKALLPFYNNGFSLKTNRDIYYMDKKIATYVPVYADGNYFWTITNDLMVYFRGKVGYQEDGKWLMSYDVKTGETKELRDWEELEKYGNVDFFTSDGTNVFIAFSAGQSLDSWYNIVKIDENGNDTLVCKTTYGSYDPDSDIKYGYLGQLMNFGEEYIFYTTGKYDDYTDEYFVKIKINFKTGEYNIVDKEEGVIGGKGKTNSNGESYWSNQYQILPDSMYFLPDNTFYYGETRQEIDELNGEKTMLTDIIRVDRNTREEKIVGTFDFSIYGSGLSYKDGDSLITDKYLVFKGNVMNLEDGKVIDYDTFISENKADDFFMMCINSY